MTHARHNSTKVSDAVTKARSLRDGLFRMTADGPTLLGSLCTRCSKVSFPATGICLACRGEDLVTIELGDRAELLCATTSHMGSQHFPPGYTVGFVEVSPGVRIFAPLRRTGGDTLRPGMPLRLEVGPLWQEGDEDILSYRFFPA